MPRHVLGTVATPSIEPVIFQGKIYEHNLTEGCGVLEKLSIVWHMFEDIAHDHCIEEVAERSRAEIAAAKFDLREAHPCTLNIGTGDIYPDFASALTYGHGRYQLPRSTPYFKYISKLLLSRNKAHQVRQFESTNFNIDLRLFIRTHLPTRDIFWMFVVERGVIDRRGRRSNPSHWVLGHIVAHPVLAARAEDSARTTRSCCGCVRSALIGRLSTRVPARTLCGQSAFAAWSAYAV